MQSKEKSMQKTGERMNSNLQNKLPSQNGESKIGKGVSAALVSPFSVRSQNETQGGRVQPFTNLANQVVADWQDKKTAQTPVPTSVSTEEIESLENKIKVLEKQICSLTTHKDEKFSTPVCMQKVQKHDAPQKDIAEFDEFMRPCPSNLQITFQTPIQQISKKAYKNERTNSGVKSSLTKKRKRDSSNNFSINQSDRIGIGLLHPSHARQLFEEDIHKLTQLPPLENMNPLMRLLDQVDNHQIPTFQRVQAHGQACRQTASQLENVLEQMNDLMNNEVDSQISDKQTLVSLKSYRQLATNLVKTLKHQQEALHDYC